MSVELGQHGFDALNFSQVGLLGQIRDQKQQLEKKDVPGHEAVDLLLVRVKTLL